jgi:hypothetical protein
MTHSTVNSRNTQLTPLKSKLFTIFDEAASSPAVHGPTNSAAGKSEMASDDSDENANEDSNKESNKNNIDTNHNNDYSNSNCDDGGSIKAMDATADISVDLDTLVLIFSFMFHF